jgi:hypothetical protein
VHEKYNQVEEDEKRAQPQQGEPDALASTDPSSQSQGGPISRVGVKNNNSGDKHSKYFFSYRCTGIFFF